MARGQGGEGAEFGIAEAKRAYELGKIGLHDGIRLKVGDEAIETTVGRAIFNEILDGKLPYVNETLGKDRIYELVETVYREHGEDEAVNLLNRIDDLGFHFATRMGASISLETLKTDVNLVEYAQKIESQLPPAVEYENSIFVVGECENSIFANIGCPRVITKPTSYRRFDGTSRDRIHQRREASPLQIHQR